MKEVPLLFDLEKSIRLTQKSQFDWLRKVNPIDSKKVNRERVDKKQSLRRPVLGEKGYFVKQAGFEVDCIVHFLYVQSGQVLYGVQRPRRGLVRCTLVQTHELYGRTDIFVRI